MGRQESITSRNDMSMIEMELDDVPGYRNVSGKEIMAYYKPTWLAVLGLFSSIMASA